MSDTHRLPTRPHGRPINPNVSPALLVAARPPCRRVMGAVWLRRLAGLSLSFVALGCHGLVASDDIGVNVGGASGASGAGSANGANGEGHPPTQGAAGASGERASGSVTDNLMGAEACWDGVDNDGDGEVDTADPDCALPGYLPACGPGETQLIYNSTGPAQWISDDQLQGPTVSISVIAPGLLARASLVVGITHSFDRDVVLSLTPPGQTEAMGVSVNNGGGGENYTDTVFNDHCALNITLGVAPFTGCFSTGGWIANTTGTLTALEGKSATGTWTVMAGDSASGDSGTLDRVVLVLCMTP